MNIGFLAHLIPLITKLSITMPFILLKIFLHIQSKHKYVSAEIFMTQTTGSFTATLHKWLQWGSVKRNQAMWFLQ